MLLLFALLATGCASTRVAAPPPPLADVVPWADVRTEARDLITRLLRTDTTNPPGREATAAEVLAEYLTRNGVAVEVIKVAPGRANLFARIPASTAEARPLILLSHLDVVGAEAEAWPKETGPFSGAISEGFVWGRGALDGKGLAAVHAVTMAVIARFKIPLGRTLLMAATADGEAHGELGISRLVAERPELLAAEIALTPGGFAVRDLLDDRALFGIAVAEKGYADIELVATGERGAGAIAPLDRAADKLSRALLRIDERRDPPRLTRPMSAFLSSVGSQLGFADRWTWSASPLTRLVTFDYLLERPLTRAMVTNTVAVTRLAGGGAGDVVPDRARASLRCHLLPGTTPGEMKVRLEDAIADPTVFLTIRSGDLATTSTVSEEHLAAFRAVIGSDAVVAPALSPDATDARVLRRQKIAAYGFTPLLVSLAEFSTIHGRNERVPVEALDRGVEMMTDLVLRLAASQSVAVKRFVDRP